MYLAGYAVECLLKAYIIQQMNAQTLVKAMAHLDSQRLSQGRKPVKNIARTAAGHQIAYLVQLTDLPTAYPGYNQELWGRIGKWQSSWRYEGLYSTSVWSRSPKPTPSGRRNCPA